MSHQAQKGAQAKEFRRAQQMLSKEGITPKWMHMGKVGNVARIGLELYLLKPALRFIAKIVQVKEIESGDKVGYDFTFTAKKKMKLAVLPAGYNEGIDRRLSNIGSVKINNKFCRFVGRISMNLSVVDVTAAGKVEAGDEAVIISDKPSDPNSLVNIAKLSATIPYEITVHVQPTIKRVAV